MVPGSRLTSPCYVCCLVCSTLLPTLNFFCFSWERPAGISACARLVHVLVLYLNCRVCTHLVLGSSLFDQTTTAQSPHFNQAEKERRVIRQVAVPCGTLHTSSAHSPASGLDYTSPLSCRIIRPNNPGIRNRPAHVSWAIESGILPSIS